MSFTHIQWGEIVAGSDCTLAIGSLGSSAPAFWPGHAARAQPKAKHAAARKRAAHGHRNAPPERARGAVFRGGEFMASSFR
ncbi:MAG TPA: hypothetical protein VFO44_09445 [Steroidobacteraceae bacterium]|nr:hypothetical protein [Steroidobacteraceae bacterium]